MWWRRPTEPDDSDGLLEAVGIMLMEMDEKLDRVLRALEDDDGWREEEEPDRP